MRRARRSALAVLGMVLAAASAGGAASLHEVLAKGSEWELRVDGDVGLLKLLGGSASRTDDGGMEVKMDVSWDGRAGILEAAESPRGGARVSLTLRGADGSEIVCRGAVADGGEFMSGSSTRSGSRAGGSGAWYATRSDGDGGAGGGQGTRPPAPVPEMMVINPGALTADRKGPTIEQSWEPSSPNTNQKVRFVAKAQDPSGIQSVEIWVNDKRTRACRLPSCSFEGGPYPFGLVKYHVVAVDRAGNREVSPTRGVRVERATTPPRSDGDDTPTRAPDDDRPERAAPKECSISGRVTGNRSFRVDVTARHSGTGRQAATVRVGSDGRYRLPKVASGTYFIELSAGKMDIDPSPSRRTVGCRGAQSHTGVDFHLR